MPELPNVNDSQWQNDRVRREDVKFIANAIGVAAEAHRRDLGPGIAKILNGFLGSEGSTLDQVVIGAGTGQDINGKRVHLAMPAAEVALLDTGGATNYFAVKHKYAYDYYEKAYYSGVKYYRTQRDDYEAVVSLSPQDEAEGHVRVFSAHKDEGVLYFNYSYRSYDEILFAKEYVLNLAEFKFNGNLVEIPGQWRPSPYTWQHKTIHVQLADSYTAFTYSALPVDLDVCVDLKAFNTTYTLGQIKDISGMNDIVIGVHVASTAPNKLLLTVVDPVPNEAKVKGKVELLGIAGAGVSEPG